MSRLSISVGPDDHVQGNPTAQCSLVEYGDYECPSCAQIQPVIKRLQKHFGWELSFVFRNFPLTDLHPWAEPAAETAEFAGAHGRFWEMHDLLFENQAMLSQPLLLSLADRLGLSSVQLQTDLEVRTYRSRVLADFEAGIRDGVNGTPTLFLNDQRYVGSFDSESLNDAIREILRLTES